MMKPVALGLDGSCGPRTSIVRSESIAGRVTHASAALDPRLAGVLARDYVGVALASHEAASWLAVPVPTVTLIVSLADPVRTEAAELPDDWVGGMSDRWDVVEMPERHASLDFKLTPLGAHRVLGRPVCDLAGGCVSLEDVFGALGRRLGDQVRDTTDWASRFDLVESFLLRRVAAGRPPTPVVAHAWSRLSRAEGALGIGELATAVGCSRRYLAAKFRSEVGLSPKTAARLLRFAAVRRRLEGEPERFADIAQARGYYDQAHLNRDFRELAGTTPSAFVARLELSRGRVGAEVAFLQDAAPAGA
jgi:AraC-like DNA-binding protein